ncbi:MAG TPA: hypothetical protein PK720_03535 [bacterium]|nr:hypothetical protein [bacterium]
MSKESLEFHIKSDDYFGTLATVLDLIKQQVFGDKKSKLKDAIESKISELLYLQKNYQIVKK